MLELYCFHNMSMNKIIYDIWLLNSGKRKRVDNVRSFIEEEAE